MNSIVKSTYILGSPKDSKLNYFNVVEKTKATSTIFRWYYFKWQFILNWYSTHNQWQAKTNHEKLWKTMTSHVVFFQRGKIVTSRLREFSRTLLNDWLLVNSNCSVQCNLCSIIYMFVIILPQGHLYLWWNLKQGSSVWMWFEQRSYSKCKHSARVGDNIKLVILIT